MIPSPSLCPACRNQRRMAHRNDRSFYKRKCDATGEQFISIYPSDSPFTVYKPSAWYSDNWDPMKYGREVDLHRPFFAQFQELQKVVPRLGIDIVNCENSDYCNYCGDDKSCYMDIAGEANEDCFYNLFIKYCKNCADCTFAYHSTLCYEAIQCYNSYGVVHSMYLEDCSDCAYCFDCKGCKNCLLSINLRNKEYCILNEQCTKEEYERKRSELKMHTWSGLKNVASIWEKVRIAKGMYRDMYNLSSEQCIGDNIKNSKNCVYAFNATNCEDCKYLNDVLDAKDCQDLNYSLYKPEAAYELISTLAMRFSAFNVASHYCSSVFYCDMVNNSKNLFGCIALNQKEYCILNKQYTKEEYERLVPQIIERMRKDSEWGEFFPHATSAFAYNETVAQEYYPMTREDVNEKNWLWREMSDEQPIVSRIIPAERLPDSIDDIPDDILNWAIQSEISGKPFRIIKQELSFYRKMRLPVPHVHPDERHQQRTSIRNPRKLWGRKCQKCGKGIETTYSLDRPEKVFCEECYLKEVY